VASSLFDLSGRRALVTGSSRGIGTALAAGLAEAAAEVVLNGRDQGTLARARDEIAASTGATVHAVAFDVTDPAAVEAGLRDIETVAGPLDILVNNAGLQHREPLLEVPVEAWRRLLDTNLTSAFIVGRAVARGMVGRGHGKIINVCSVQSWLARPGIAGYAAAKGGLAMLTRSMCAEWAGSGVTVNGLAPGYVVTELTRALADDPEFDRWLRGRTPAGRWAGGCRRRRADRGDLRRAGRAHRGGLGGPDVPTAADHRERPDRTARLPVTRGPRG
jgi:gluconate 5-dehydrogenase